MKSIVFADSSRLLVPAKRHACSQRPRKRTMGFDVALNLYHSVKANIEMQIE